ncbi:MAG: LysR family transcriptional regulator [Amphritea sp.]
MNQLKAMKIFAVVVEEGSMSAAARRLGIANSVVTKNLNELEDWLGRKLIYRSTRSLRLSQEGHSYLEQIRDIISRVEVLERPVELENKLLKGTLKVTAPVILGKKLISPLLPGFYNEYPGLKIQLVLNDDFNDMVEEGFDLALRVSRLPDSNFIAKRLWPMSLKLVASATYIEQFGAPLTPESLNRHVCLIDSSTANARRWQFRAPNGDSLGVHIDGPIDVNNAECITLLCESGLGISQIPNFFVDASIREGKLIELLPEYSIDDAYISLLYHQKGTKNPATKVLIDYLSENIKIDSYTFSI